MIAFQDKVTTERDDTLRADATEVTITLKDGRRHVCRIDHCIGSASNPMTDEQLARKFADLAEPVVGAQRGAVLVERAWAAESLADIGELARAAA